MGQKGKTGLFLRVSIKDANEEYVMHLRVPDNASDNQIQSALHKLFSSHHQLVQGPEGHSQDPQGHRQGPQGNFVTINNDQVKEQDNFDIKPSIIAPTTVSKLQLGYSV